MKRSSRIVLVLTVLLLSIGCDQILKQIARTLLRYSPPISFWSDFVRLQYAENSGVMLSIGAFLSPELRFWMFTVLVGLLLVILLGYVLLNNSMDRMLTVGWSLIVAGGLGNLIDRLVRGGVVIDFISVGFGIVRTAVFNVADALVFAGVFFLLIHRKKKEGGEGSAPASETDGPVR